MSDERHNPGRERFDDLKEAYALGALSEEERQEVEDYLMTHPELRAEVDDLKSVANLRWFVCGVVIRAVPHSVS
jgi:anti-sigma-K factor RskA